MFLNGQMQYLRRYTSANITALLQIFQHLMLLSMVTVDVGGFAFVVDLRPRKQHGNVEAVMYLTTLYNTWCTCFHHYVITYLEDGVMVKKCFQAHVST